MFTKGKVTEKIYLDDGFCKFFDEEQKKNMLFYFFIFTEVTEKTERSDTASF